MVALSVKNLPTMLETWVRFLGQKTPWRRKGKYSCLENPMDRGAWQAIVQEVTKSQTPLSK